MLLMSQVDGMRTKDEERQGGNYKNVPIWGLKEEYMNASGKHCLIFCSNIRDCNSVRKVNLVFMQLQLNGVIAPRK